MRRSAIFNGKYPAPLDSALYPLYKQFIQLKQEVTKNWIQEVVQGAMGERGYEDLQDCRLDVTPNGDVIMRLKPVIGFDTEDEMKSHVEFFNLYRDITTHLINKLIIFWSNKDGWVRKDNDAVVSLYVQNWKKLHNSRVHKLIMALKVLVTLKNHDRLHDADLPFFRNLIDGQNEDESISQIDLIIRANGFGELFSPQFAEGTASFYQHPDTELVQSYWHYSRVQYRTLKSAEDRNSQ